MPELKKYGLFKSAALPATAGDALPTGLSMPMGVMVKSEQGVKREQLVQHSDSFGVGSASSGAASPAKDRLRLIGLLRLWALLNRLGLIVIAFARVCAVAKPATPGEIASIATRSSLVALNT